MATKRASAFQRTRESTPGRSIKCAGTCGKRGDYQHLGQLYSRNPILPQCHILRLHCFQYCVHQLLHCLLHWFVVYHPKTALVYWLVWPRLGQVGVGGSYNQHALAGKVGGHARQRGRLNTLHHNYRTSGHPDFTLFRLNLYPGYTFPRLVLAAPISTKIKQKSLQDQSMQQAIQGSKFGIYALCCSDLH